MPRNKFQDEVLYMNLFREKYEDFPKGKLVKMESPDFVLKVSPKRSIGIELTQLYRGTSNEKLRISMLVTELKDTLLNKAEKLPLYRKKAFNEYWLIITCDSLDLIDGFSIQQKLDKVNFESGFDEVFLFELFKGSIFQI